MSARQPLYDLPDYRLKLEQIEIALETGRQLRCSCYIVSNSNRGAVMYTWCERTIRNFIRVAEREGRKFFGDHPVIVVPPNINRDDPDHPHLPLYRFIGEYTSDPIDETEHWSTAIVIWYQNAQFPVIGDDARAAFTGIDWDAVAADGTLEY